MMTASETSAPDHQAHDPKPTSRFPSVDWASVRGKFSLTGLDPEGGGVGASKGLDDAASDRYAPSARVGASRSDGGSKDPSRPERGRSAKRMGDIRNLVVEGDGGGGGAGDAAATGAEGAAGRRGPTPRAVWALVVLSVACLVAGGGVLLRAGDARRREEQGRLLEIAEDVVAACGDLELADDSTECKELCEENMCCFLEGEDSCVDDEDRDTYCAVYAGCEALLEEEVRLFLLAQEIGSACSEPRISENEDDCDALCSSHLCCFVSGEYSCLDDESMTCAVYAGCVALMPEVTWDN